MASLIATAQGSYILVKVVHLILNSGFRDANCEYLFTLNDTREGLIIFHNRNKKFLAKIIEHKSYAYLP